MKPHRARKRFGQNFLHDPQVIARILAHIHPRPGERIVEIGPGLGALTVPLMENVHEIDVVELDRDLIPRLKAACTGKGELHVHQADALEFDFARLHPGEPLRLVGNLPYNISTPLIFHLIESAALIHDMHFMLQKEVVDRIVAAPNSGDYGRLSVMTRYYCRPEKCLTVGPGAFRPAPKVHSAVVRLTPHATPPVEVHDLRTFKQTVTEAFNQRRKTLGRIFKNRLNADDFKDLGVTPSARPETLDLTGFAALSNQFGELAVDERS